MAKPSTYSTEDIELLRQWTRALMKDKGWTATELGRQVTVKQQNMSRWLGDKPKGGPSRETMNSIAALAGFSDSDQLLRELKIGEEMRPKKGNLWAQRDSAARVAKLIGHGDDAIRIVLERYAEPEFQAKDVKWWVDEIVLEALRLDARKVRK